MCKCLLKLVKNFSMLNLVLLLLCTNCSRLVKKIETEDSGIKEINIMANLSNSRIIKLSDIASSIKYCKLETDRKCLVHHQMKFYCAKEYIVSIGWDEPSHQACYVFDRKTGKFVRQISRFGQGPGEYIELEENFWDEKYEQVCMWSHPNYIFYNLDETISHRINRNEHPISFSSTIVYGDHYVRYIQNHSGNEKRRIVFYDRTGALIDSIPNFRTWERSEGSRGGRAMFHVFNNELYYTDIFCDTLFQIKDFTLHPRYIFNTGGRTLPYQKHATGRDELQLMLRGDADIYTWHEPYIVIGKIFEDAKRLYFTFDYRRKRYPAVYKKTERDLLIMPPITVPIIRRDMIIPLYGFDNDLDGGLPFWPQQMISDKEMMCVYSTTELLALDASKITDEKLKNVLNSLEEDSNPVVAIVTLKD